MNNEHFNGKLFGFTIKETYSKESYLTEATYERAIQAIRSRGDIISCVFETTRGDGKPARLHCHGIVSFNRIPLLTSIVPKTFSCRFERIFNYDGWNRYCNKQSERELRAHFREVVY